MELRYGELAYKAEVPRHCSAHTDLHGDFAHALRTLRAASLVDQRGRWIGKTATLVQTGDIVDRGTDTIALYRLFDQLRDQAADAGGKVISLLGNHEVSPLRHFAWQIIVQSPFPAHERDGRLAVRDQGEFSVISSIE